MIVALPRAVPIPRPLIAFGPTRLNLKKSVDDKYGRRLSITDMGAFCSISGTMKNLTMLPRIYTWSSCETRPSRPVTVMSFKEMFRLSSARMSSQQMGRITIALQHIPSASLPRYSWPVLSSTVTTCPRDSCRSLTGTPRPAMLSSVLGSLFWLVVSHSFLTTVSSELKGYLNVIPRYYRILEVRSMRTFGGL
jgi:hypothetical protein